MPPQLFPRNACRPTVCTAYNTGLGAGPAAGLQTSLQASVPNTSATSLLHSLNFSHRFIYFGPKEPSAKIPPEDKSWPVWIPLWEWMCDSLLTEQAASWALRKRDTRFGRGEGRAEAQAQNMEQDWPGSPGPSWALRGWDRKDRRPPGNTGGSMNLWGPSYPNSVQCLEITSYVCKGFRVYKALRTTITSSGPKNKEKRQNTHTHF